MLSRTDMLHRPRPLAALTLSLLTALAVGCVDEPLAPEPTLAGTEDVTATRPTLEELDALLVRLQADYPDLALEDATFAVILTEAVRDWSPAPIATWSYELGGTTLTGAELQLLLTYPWRITKTRQASDDAKARAAVVFPGGQYRNRADAFRHAYWNVLLAKRINLSWAQAFATAHESESSGVDKAMDLHNNAVGRGIYAVHQSASEPSLSAYVQTKCYTRVATAAQMSTGCLVFLDY